jgi:hypothetical protein
MDIACRSLPSRPFSIRFLVDPGKDLELEDYSFDYDYVCASYFWCF